MDEASKTKALWGDFERSIVSGNGIDIGCGVDPITKTVRRFDVEDGDANEVTKYVHEQFDFVFSAHCLEHMLDPAFSLKNWWELVRPGGYLIFIVPDEDLYEQGYWPSLFNPDHKSSFTIRKDKSWSPRSYNITDMVHSLEASEQISSQLQDSHYDKRFLNHSTHSRITAQFGIKTRNSLIKRSKTLGLSQAVLNIFSLLRLPADQTAGRALAQIQTIVRKNNS